jgi:hypothetical protein
VIDNVQNPREMVSRGDLLGFADDMLIMTYSKVEMTLAWTLSVANGI